jgi:hypothetical protein
MALPSGASTTLASPSAPTHSTPSPRQHRSMLLDINPRNKKKTKLRYSQLVWILVPLLVLQVAIFHFHIQAITTTEPPLKINTTEPLGGGDGGGSLDMEEWEQMLLLASNDANEHSKPQNPSQRNTINSNVPHLNGYPLHYHPPPSASLHRNASHWPHYYYSKIHCVGETYPAETTRQPRTFAEKKQKMEQFEWTWMSRSCHFSFLCLDLEEKDYVLFRDPREHQRLVPYLERRRPDGNEKSDSQASSSNSWRDASQSFLLTHPPITTTTTTNKKTRVDPLGVSLGGINRKWMMKKIGVGRLKWFPRIVDDITAENISNSSESQSGHVPLYQEGFYTLPSHVIMIPFHSLAAYNPGHLVRGSSRRSLVGLGSEFRSDVPLE